MTLLEAHRPLGGRVILIVFRANQGLLQLKVHWRESIAATELDTQETGVREVLGAQGAARVASVAPPITGWTIKARSTPRVTGNTHEPSLSLM